MENATAQDASMVRPLSGEELRIVQSREFRAMSKEQVVDWLLSKSFWDCFLTCTFRRRRDLIETEKLFRAWHHQHWFGVPCFYSVENHPGGHGGHLHGLMTLWPRKLQRTAFYKSWFKLYGRCSFKPPRDLRKTAGYCSPTTVCEVIKDGTWGFLNVSLNSEKYFRSLRETMRQTAAREARSCDTEVTIEDVIEGKLGLPAPELELDLKEQVNLWK